MAANEVNDIIIRLLAAADKIGGREREEILHHIGRLSRAATRERTVAVDEMQRLRKKVLQQSTELKRLTNPSSTQFLQATQPPLAGGYDFIADSRLQALRSHSSLVLDYGSDHEPDYGRLDRPEGLSQPMRKSVAAETGQVGASSDQTRPLRETPVGSPAPSQAHVAQEKPEYGPFNSARLLALQSGPSDTRSPGQAEDRASLSDGPPPPTYQVTAANAEPVAPRERTRSKRGRRANSSAQAVEQLLDEIQASSSASAGQKRRMPGDSVIETSSAKRQLLADDTHVIPSSRNPMTTTSQPVSSALKDLQSHIHEPFMSTESRPPRLGKPICTHCFQRKAWSCNGKAHCDHSLSHKCYYVLCNPTTCLGANCVKIHPSQYSLAKRKPGQPRRFVIGDLNSVQHGAWDRSMHGEAVAAMDRPVLGNLPTSFPGVQPTQLTGTTQQHSHSEKRHPFDVPDAVRDAPFRGGLPAMPDPIRPAASLDTRPMKVETDDSWIARS